MNPAPGDFAYSPLGLVFVYALEARLIDDPDEWIEGAYVFDEASEIDDPPTWVPLSRLELVVGTVGEGG